MKVSKRTELLDKYHTWLLRSRAENTAELYYQRAKAFLKWAGRRKITGKLLDDYINHLTNEGKSRNTLATYYMNIRSLYKYMGLGAELNNLQAPQFVETEITCPTKEDIDKMLEVAVKPFERALLTLQFNAGLRVKELRQLKRSDLVIHPNGSGEVIVRSAKTRGRIEDVRVSIGAGVVAEVAAWLNGRDDDLEPMFPSKKARDGMLSAEAINYTYKRLCERAGIPKITSHQLRHAVTTWLLLKGVSRDDVMKHCRWNSEKSMRRYDHLLPTDIRGRIPDPFPEEDDDERREPGDGEEEE